MANISKNHERGVTASDEYEPICSVFLSSCLGQENNDIKNNENECNSDMESNVGSTETLEISEISNIIRIPAKIYNFFRILLFLFDFYDIMGDMN